MSRDRGRQADRAGDRQRLQAEALADPTRFAAYQHIRRAAQPLSVAEVTGAVGVHHTAVRAHLTKLRDAGLITESHAEPSGRGRPKLLYTAVDSTVGTGRDAYQELSSMLARVVREGSTPRLVGAAAGRVDSLLAPDSALLGSLKQASDELGRSAATLRQALGEDSALMQNTDGAMQELRRSARSVRNLVDLLERNPEALLRGRPAAP